MTRTTVVLRTSVEAPHAFTAQQRAGAIIESSPSLRECVDRVDGDGSPPVLIYTSEVDTDGVHGAAYITTARDGTSYTLHVVVDPATAATVVRTDTRDWHIDGAAADGEAHLGTAGAREPWRVADLLQGCGQAIAIRDEECAVTYAQLRDAVIAVATRVIHAGVTSHVMLRGGRDVRTAVAMLGCWMAGAAWCAVDVDAAATRREAIEMEVQPGLVLDTADIDLAATVSELPAQLPGRLAPDDVAYLVASSGSTGTPKVSALPAGGLAPLMRAWREEYRFDAPQTVCQIGSLEGDVFLGDLLKALWTGGTLEIVPDAQRADPDAIAAHITAVACSFVESTPVVVTAVLRALDRKNGHWPAVVVVGSDVFRASEARTLTALARGRTRVVNGYGTTECMIESLVHDCEAVPVDLDSLCPIGRPLPGTRLTVRRPDGSVAQLGEVGALHLKSPGARLGLVRGGTLQPCGPEVDTGDRAALDPSGVVFLYGRTDSMVKVRGYRVEMAEVEDTLLRVDGVAEAYVTSFRRAGATELMAFLGARGTDISTVKTALRTTLIPAAVPAVIHIDRDLPRLDTGKLDRLTMNRRAREHEANLDGVVVNAPAPSAPIGLSGDRETLERTVAACWEQVLGVTPDRTASFFDQGGTSVLLIALAEQLRVALGAEAVVMTDLFRHPNIVSYVDMLLSRNSQSDVRSTMDEPRSRRRILEEVAAKRITVAQARRLMAL